MNRQRMRYFVDQFCITGPQTEVVVTVLLVVGTIILMAIAVHLFKLANEKHARIQEPSPSHPWDKTYCTLTLTQVRTVQVCLVVILANQLQVLIQLLCGPRFIDVYYSG